MICDQLENSKLYLPLHSGFVTAFDFLRSFDRSVPIGKIAIDGDRVFASIQHYNTEAASSKAWEAHRKYIDIQCVFTGNEEIFCSPIGALTVVRAYDPDSDFESFSGPARQSIILSVGDFAIFFPQDGHKPGCIAGKFASVLKVVVKVRV